MNKKKKSILKATLLRTVVLLMVLTVVGAVLTSCSGCSGKNSKVEVDYIEYDSSVNTLKYDQLKVLAEFILNNKETKEAGDGNQYTLREMFTAAYRGIDMNASGFVDAEAEPKFVTYTETKAEITAAEETLAEETANAETSDAEATSAETGAVELIRYDSDLEAGIKALGKFGAVDECSDYDKMSKEDMRTIILAMANASKLEIGRISGFLNYILYYIGIALNWVTNLLGGSYILGLLVFAIVMEAVLIVFSIKQQKNSIKQAMLAPKERAIRKKYAGRNDNVTKQKMSEEIQAMYQRENYNPLSGCLPLLLQLPIIAALYYIVIDPMQYMLGQNAALTSALSTFYKTAHAAGGYGDVAFTASRGTIGILSRVKDVGVDAFAGIKDFVYFGGSTGANAYEALGEIGGKIPNFTIGRVNLGFTPAFSDLKPLNIQAWLLLVPILTFLAYFFSMKLTKKLSYQSQMQAEQSAGCSGKMMDWMMPLFSVFISFGVPAAIGVYWIFKSIIGVLKQFLLSKAMPLPKFTEEDYKAAERELMGKAPKRSGGNGGGGNGARPRSLHYIDDDEYESTAPVKKKSNAPYVEDDEPESKPEPKTDAKTEKKKSMLSGAEMKDYGQDKDQNDDQNSDE